MYKNIIFIINFCLVGLCVSWQSSLYSQSVAINSSGDIPHTSAILDIKSNTQGILFPRMTLTQRLDIDSPPDGLLVYQTDGNEGIYVVVEGEWKGLSKKNYDNIPVGGIIDWLPQGQSLPEGFTICDGTIISDQESPYFNSTLPFLNEKFIKAIDINFLGIAGGATAHKHTFNLGTVQTSSSDNPHTHNISGNLLLTNMLAHGHTINSQVQIIESEHNHEWGSLNSSENWYSGDGQLLVNWSNGVGPEGSGYYPIAKKSVGGVSSTLVYYTDNANTHTHNNGSKDYSQNLLPVSHFHTITLQPRISTEDHHSHSLSLGEKITGFGSNLPPYIKLLKIMRIK